MFAVAVSLITGKILYISDQAASILRCKRGYFKNAKFVEFLAPQDVSVFYTSTTPYRLPSWNICNRAGEWSRQQMFLWPSFSHKNANTCTDFERPSIFPHPLFRM